MSSPAIVLHRQTVTATDGVRLSVLVAAPDYRRIDARPALPPVLAVHGFASSADSGWRRTGHLDALTRAGRVVIAPDLRGHGESDHPHSSAAYTLPTMLSDLVAVLAAVRAAAEADAPGYPTAVPKVAAVPNVTAVPKITAPPNAASATVQAGVVDLLGYSLGARLCWSLASQHRLPVRRMVLGGFDGRPLFEGVDPERLDRLAAGVPTNDRVALHHLVEGLAGTGGAAADGPWPASPVLVVAGDRDPLGARAAEFAERMPGGSFLAVPGRDHISTVPASTFRAGVVGFLGYPAGAPE